MEINKYEINMKYCCESFSISQTLMLSSASKLTKFIAPNQLTEEFGGTLQYNHEDWIQNRQVSMWYRPKTVERF